MSESESIKNQTFTIHGVLFEQLRHADIVRIQTEQGSLDVPTEAILEYYQAVNLASQLAELMQALAKYK